MKEALKLLGIAVAGILSEAVFAGFWGWLFALAFHICFVKSFVGIMFALTMIDIAALKLKAIGEHKA